MDRLFQWYKYLKYILLPIIILKYLQVEGVQNGHPLIILEYALLFGVSFLLIILQDFSPLVKTKFLLRLIILIILLFLAITAIVYQAIMSFIFQPYY